MTEKEAWQNTSRGSVYVKKYGARGEETTVRVLGGQVVTLSPEERKLTTMAIPPKNKHLNVFENGVLIPLQLVDSAEDYEEIASNPNLLGDSDIREALREKTPTLKKTLAEISNVNLVRRFQELAAEEEDKMTMPKIRAIEARLEELTASEVKKVESELPDNFDQL